MSVCLLALVYYAVTLSVLQMALITTALIHYVITHVHTFTFSITIKSTAYMTLWVPVAC